MAKHFSGFLPYRRPAAWGWRWGPPEAERQARTR